MRQRLGKKPKRIGDVKHCARIGRLAACTLRSRSSNPRKVLCVSLSLSYKSALLIPLVGVLAGCDTVRTGSPGAAEARQAPLVTEDYTYEDGRSTQVGLDPRHAPERRSYATLDLYDAALESLGEQKTVKVNAELWERLKHANDPAEVALLDAEGRVEVEGFLYEVGTEAVYRTDLARPGAEPELVLYYGLSGGADLDEFTRAASAYAGPDVDPASFKNPFAQEMAREAARLKTAEFSSVWEGPAADARSFCTDVPLNNDRDAKYCELDDLYISDGQFNLPSGYADGSGTYRVRAWLLNQSYRSGFRKKAYGVTQIQVRKLVPNNPNFFGLSEATCPQNLTTSPFSYYFRTQTNVEGQLSGLEYCIASKTASRRGGAQSEHDVWIRYSASTNLRVLDREFLQ